MLPFSQRPQTLREGSALPASTRRPRHSLPFQLRDRSRFKISRTLLSPGPQPAPAPQFRSTALGSDLATFDPFTGRGEIEIANGFANILPTPLRPISRVLAKVSSSTRLPVDSIVRPLAISRWSAQNSL